MMALAHNSQSDHSPGVKRWPLTFLLSHLCSPPLPGYSKVQIMQYTDWKNLYHHYLLNELL